MKQTEGVDVYIGSIEEQIDKLKANVAKQRGTLREYVNEELKKMIGVKFSAMKVRHHVRQLTEEV